MSASQYSTFFQTSIISLALNSFLLEVFTFGIYTVVYFGTLYVYLISTVSKKLSRSWIVAGTISLLYALYIVQIGVQWYNTKYGFIDNGQTQATVFMAALVTPAWVTFVNATCSLLEGAVADGLLLWRCFHVWNGSLRAVALPSFLLFCECALNLTVIIMSSPGNFSSNRTETVDRLIGAATFITFGTTLVVTLLISYRIHSTSTKQDLPRASRSRFTHILEILIQSAAIYSLVAAASATATIIPVNDDNALQLLSAQVYTSVLYSFIAGIAPTIMVARVALASSAPTEMSAVTHLSGLQFHERFGASEISDEVLNNAENASAILLRESGYLKEK